MQANHALWIALLCVSSTAAADPPLCHKWTNNLSDCAALELQNNCSLTGVDGGIQKEVAMSRRFGPTALDVCKKVVKHTNAFNIANGGVPLFGYTNGETIRACWFKTEGPDQDKCFDVEEDFPFPKQVNARCTYDANNDGDIDWDDTSSSFLVSYGQINPEAHCFCTANGPHASMTNDDWEMQGPLWQQASELSKAYFQHKFPSGLRKAILERNFKKNGSQYNGRFAVYKSEAKYSSTSVLNPTNAVMFDPEPVLQTWNTENADAAQIDHIIPRVDSQGCLCGDVTPNNAAVTSLELNQTMSNISPKWNVNRARMYEKYVTCPDPSVAQYQGQTAQVAESRFPWQHVQDDENTSCVATADRVPEPPAPRVASYDPADETGGCSAGGASGLGIVFAFFAARRRRRARRD